MADYIATTKPADTRAPIGCSSSPTSAEKIPAQADTLHSIRHLNQIDLSRRWDFCAAAPPWSDGVGLEWALAT